MKKYLLMLSLMFVVACRTNGVMGKNSTDRPIMLEIVGDSQARQLYIDGFDKLNAREKILAYYIFQAGIAGRDIFYDQNHKRALEIRHLCEEIILHGKELRPDIYQRIRRYLHRIWMNSCQYDQNSKKKFIPEFSYDEFIYAAELAQRNGADLRLPLDRDLTAYIASLKPAMFDPSHQPMLTLKKVHPDEDILRVSGNNFYDSVTLSEVHQWELAGLEAYPLNSRISKSGGIIVEQVYRAGEPDSGIAPGCYAAQLSKVIDFLELAIPHADSVQKLSIGHLIRFYRTGNMKHMNRFAIEWVRHNPRVDFLQGFIEVYIDPRGKKGSFQNLVYFIDADKTEQMKKLVDLTEYFEDNAPYPELYKRRSFPTKPSAIAAMIISGTGDGGPIPPAGLNLPNDQYFRETYGSKNLIFTNVMGLSGGNSYTGRREYVRRFVYDFFHPHDIDALMNVNEDAYFAMVCLHELIGHGSGRVNPALPGDPSDYIREYYATIEETRAELMALWNIHDPKLRQIGLVPDVQAADEIFRHWARYDLIRLAQMENRETIEEDHDRARHMIIGYIRERGAISINKIKGQLYAKVNSIPAFRAAVGDLLGEITRIKGEGDYEAARALVEKYGIHFDTFWRDEMVARYKFLRDKEPIINSIGFSMPILLAVKDKHGRIRDVRLKYLKDFEKEQLFYSEKISLD